MAAANGWTEIKRQLREAADSHPIRTDSALYNGGTAAVLLATAIATFLPTDFDPDWLPRALTGFAAFWIGLERALGFGARWRYHREMRASYRGLMQTIDFYLATKDELPVEESQQLRRDILEKMALLQHREGGIPGTDAAAMLPAK